jgi:hypothetical protein
VVQCFPALGTWCLPLYNLLIYPPPPQSTGIIKLRAKVDFELLDAMGYGQNLEPQAFRLRLRRQKTGLRTPSGVMIFYSLFGWQGYMSHAVCSFWPLVNITRVGRSGVPPARGSICRRCPPVNWRAIFGSPWGLSFNSARGIAWLRHALANAERSVAVNFTRSPGCRRVGGFAEASNMRSGVRPMRRQPPGESEG